MNTLPSAPGRQMARRSGLDALLGTESTSGSCCKNSKIMLRGTRRGYCSPAGEGLVQPELCTRSPDITYNDMSHGDLGPEGESLRGSWAWGSTMMGSAAWASS